jgi:hypothetical protein
LFLPGLYGKVQVVAALHNTLPDLNALDVEELRALAVEQHAQLVSRDAAGPQTQADAVRPEI